MTPSPNDQLDARIRASHDTNIPDDEQLSRMWTTVLGRLDDDTAAPSMPVVRRTRPARFALVGVGAAAIALGVALSPFDSSTDNRVVPAPASAHAAQVALERAADAAGEAPWRPLSADEYNHTMTTSFAPKIPDHNGDMARYANAPRAGGASSEETFLDRNGRGMQLRVMGSNGNPDEYVTPMKPDRHGRISGFVMPNRGADTTVGSVADQLRYTFMVDVWKWPRGGGRPVRMNWFRTPTGFKTGAPMSGSAIPKAGLSLGERFQRDLWGAPLRDLDRLNQASPEQIDSLLDPILGEHPDGEISIVGPIVGGPYDETAKWFAAQIEVQRAVKLLGSAPLAPAVRTELFRRLAAQSHATLTRGARDQLGRSGSRITFEWLLDEPIPSFTVTKEQLRQDAIAKQQPAAGYIAGPDLVKVPAHRSVGRWYQSIILDEATGTILQQEAYSDWKTTIPVPRVGTTTRRAHPIDGVGWNLAIRMEPGWYGTMDAETYGVRERTTSISNVRTAACATTPRMCR